MRPANFNISEIIHLGTANSDLRTISSFQRQAKAAATPKGSQTHENRKPPAAHSHLSRIPHADTPVLVDVDSNLSRPSWTTRRSRSSGARSKTEMVFALAGTSFPALVLSVLDAFRALCPVACIPTYTRVYRKPLASSCLSARSTHP